MQEKSRNKNILMVVTVLLCLLLLMGSPAISAYFTDGDSSGNAFQVGEEKSSISEVFSLPAVLTAGTSFQKTVKVTNDGRVPIYVRVLVLFDNSMEQYCTVDWNETDWVYDSGDGYWYCPKVLEEGMTSSSLFTRVTIDDDAPEALYTDFEIIVYEESVEAHQGQGFSDYSGAWKHFQKNQTK